MMNQDRLIDSAEVRTRTHRASAESVGEVPDRQACIDVAIEFNRLFILKGDDLAVTFREFLLEKVLELTGSEYGYIAEVLRDNDGSPYLKVFGYALTDISWDDATKKLYADNLATGLEFHELNSIWGEGVKTAGVVISNAETDPRRTGTPPGHPPLHSFMGLPLIVNGELRGQIAVANRVNGYEDAWPELLTPILEACGTAMVVARSRIDQASHTENLKASRDLLARQHEEVLEILRVRDTLVSSIVHELRTPMSAMVVYARLLLQDAEPQTETYEYISALNRNADRLAGLLENVVLTVNSRDQLPVLSKVKTNVADLVQSAIEDCLTAPRQNRSAFPPIFRIEGDAPLTIEIDPLRFTQVMINVIDNALKYAPEAPILVTVRSHEDDIEVEVQDQGPGLSDVELRRVRIPFYRGAGALESTTGGTGLGLSIVDQIMRAHGGGLLIESALGEGTVLKLVFRR